MTRHPATSRPSRWLGATTSFAYDSHRNLESIASPDGSAKQFRYNAQGQVTQTVDALGRSTTLTYDTSGRVTLEQFADGTSETFTYDAFGQLTSATDPGGTTTLEYDNPADPSQLTKIRYPSGQFLEYSYDAADRETRMVDQDGFTENYAYDSNGLLSEVTDSLGKLITRYIYDATGRLIEQDDGNGTSTTHAYDADGNVIHIINYAPDHSINSRFDYTYDARGLETSMTTLDGTTSYGYDSDGELTSVTCREAKSPIISTTPMATASR